MLLSALPLDVQAVLRKFIANTTLKCVVLYGSCASGNTHPESDIDIGVAADSKLEMAAFMELIHDVSGLSDKKIDLVDLHTVHPPFTQELFKDGIWFKKDNDIYFNILRKSLYEVADFLPLRDAVIKAKIKRFTGDI